MSETMIAPPVDGGDATATVSFALYGVGLVVTSNSAALLTSMTRDFEYFVAPAPAAPIVLRAHLAAPPWERIPERPASMLTPNAVMYDDGQVRWADYHRRALASFDFARDVGEIWSEDPDLLYEIAYLMALSRIGERHDLAGIHRVHALGVVIAGRAALVLLPEGGGKSTLALELLRRRDVGLLSDDTPLLAGGDALAFPTRIGVRGAPADVAPEHVRVVRRREREAKTVIDYSGFRDRVPPRAPVTAVIIGARHSGPRSWLEPLARRRAIAPLAVNVVFGLGLPQVVEYFLRGGAADGLRKARIVASRLAACGRLLRHARCHRLVIGRDVAGAAAAVAAALEVGATHLATAAPGSAASPPRPATPEPTGAPRVPGAAEP